MPLRFTFVVLVTVSFGLILAADGFCQAPQPGDKQDPITIGEPPGTDNCYRTANTSCSLHITLDAGRPTCGDRSCGWGLEEKPVVDENGDPVLDENGNPVTETKTVPMCVTPAGELPFEENVLPIQVPNIAHVTDGHGRETPIEADQVMCVGRYKCLCTEAKSRDTPAGPCATDSDFFDTDYPVIGLVVDDEDLDDVCEGTPNDDPFGGDIDDQTTNGN